MTKDEREKRDAKDRALLNSWHPYVHNAMKAVHAKFKMDSKFILTESDLKCWLFYYLQDEKPYIPFAVHSEVTHFAEHEIQNGQKKPSKYKFRDLSLLCPWEVAANEELLEEGSSKNDILSKGFRHRAPAIHFELKFVRENGQNNQFQGLKSDIQKINSYHPEDDSNIRDFVIVCGSRNSTTTVKNLITTLNKVVLSNKNTFFTNRVRVCVFDSSQFIYLKFNGTEWVCNDSESVVRDDE